MMRRDLVRWVFFGCLLVAVPASAQVTGPDLSTASLEHLTQLQVSVSSFARKDEDLWKIPAAVFVITREDIDRSAATSIPELLRTVPGMQVAQATSSTWAVSARGFNGESAAKLLVLLDGRTVYSEIYSGAHWDEDDLPLEEIERIEVVRGPGAAVWGTNAVNGVVNIITRPARSTVGMRASTRVGRIGGTTTLRYGGSLGDRVQYRGYASLLNRTPFDTANGQRDFDGENTARAGARLDWQRGRSDWFTVSGSIYGGHLKERIVPALLIPTGPNGDEVGSLYGGYVLGLWEHKGGRADSGLQIYLDETARHDIGTYVRTRTLDVDFHSHLPLGAKNDLVWGGEMRLTADHIVGAIPLTGGPNFNNYLVDAFAQDDVVLVPNRLVLTLGSKIQNGTLAGFQLQPSARLLWSPSRKLSFWAAASHAVVAPTIQDKSIVVPVTFGLVPTPYGPLPLNGLLLGNPNFKPETVQAYEAGYRERLTRTLSIDLASFVNVNRRLQGYASAPPVLVLAPAPHLFTQSEFANCFRATTAGTEVALTWKPGSALSVQGGYTWMQARITATQSGTLSLADSWSSPRNTVTVSPTWAFAPRWSLNAFVSHVDSLPPPTVSGQPNSGTTVPAYTRLDLHLMRKVGRAIVLDAGGTNLLRPRHSEFGGGSDLVVPGFVPRSLFLKAEWTF